MRARKGAAATQAKKRLFKRAKGFVGGRRKLLRTVKETLLRAGKFAYRDRRARKRNFRRLWIIRLSAACRERDIRYSQFIAGLEKANIELDRKSLSEIAIADPPAFDAVVAAVKKAAGL
jgi:large subunit ribosomal protein L20